MLALACGLANPEAQFTLVDESYMAVQSARENWTAAFGDRPVAIRAADGLADQPPRSLDLILCNPPFHQQQVVGDFLAWRMFQQARAALTEQGELWLVGNRHLGYHAKLKRLFRRRRTDRGHPEIRGAQGGPTSLTSTPERELPACLPCPSISTTSPWSSN